MPNCFNLTRKTDIPAGPVSLMKIDEEMCKHFGVPCNPKRWYHEWYDTIGFGLAMGRSFAYQIEQAIEKIASADDTPNGVINKRYWEKQLAILNWLDANFSSDAWVEIGRRD